MKAAQGAEPPFYLGSPFLANPAIFLYIFSKGHTTPTKERSMEEKKILNDVRFAKAGEIMTRFVIAIDGHKTVADAIRLMRSERVSCLIVNRRGPGDAWGMMTRRDVVNKIVDPGRDPEQVKVHEIMTKPVITVPPDLALKYCARLMHNAGLRRLVIFDGNDIVGILSNTDIFNVIKV
jgi:CBS domain-containing protein